MKKSNEKGITLIALGITIVVLLIILSVATYSGIQTINSGKLTLFTTELKAMQTKVNDLYQDMVDGNKVTIDGIEYKGDGTETKAGEENWPGIQTIGAQISSLSSEQQEQANKAFAAVNITDNSEKAKFRHYSKDFIQNKLGVESVNQELLVNIEKRKVISLYGLKYDDETTYYTLDQVPNGEYNVDYQGNSGAPTFTAGIKTVAENERWEISVNNIQYNGSINKWKVKYKLIGEDNWYTSEDTTFLVKKPGTYQLVIFNGDVTSNLSTPIEVRAERYYYAKDISKDKNVVSQLYGKYVDCEIDVDNNTNDDTDWQIYYADENNIYLISELVDTNKLPIKDGTSIDKIATSTIYGYFENIVARYGVYIPSAFTQNDVIYNKWLSKYNTALVSNNSGNNNIKATQYLLDSTIWNDRFLTNNSDLTSEQRATVTAQTEYVIGGVPLELLTKSYNSTHTETTDKKIYLLADTTGYKYAWKAIDPGADTTQYVTCNTSDIIVEQTTSYSGIYKIDSNYWLASPTASANSVTVMNKGGYIGSFDYNYHNDSNVNDNVGFRLLICLKKDAKISTQGHSGISAEPYRITYSND